MDRPYATEAPERTKIDARPGPLLIEFGVDWCPHCQGAQSAITAALNSRPPIEHLKIEDGPGRPLGRSFRVKLWPTLVLMKDGQELGRVVRPTDPAPLRELLDRASN